MPNASCDRPRDERATVERRPLVRANRPGIAPELRRLIQQPRHVLATRGDVHARTATATDHRQALDVPAVG